MAQAAHALDLTRPHWAGDLSDIDNHLEIYSGTVDTQFEYEATFRSLSTQKSTAGRSNTIRIDRVGNSEVLARKSGDTVEGQRVKSEKLNIVVEVMLYIRNQVDYIDEWTAPDYWVEMGRNNATQFALEFDQAHIIRLQKAPEWTAPTSLAGSFEDGFHVDVTIGGANSVTQDALDADAIALVNAHARVVNELVRRRVPMQDVITVVDTDIYSTLIQHPRLLNKDYVGENGDFSGRRLVRVNGVLVIESVAFPRGAITGHNLSTDVNDNAFDVTTEEASGRMIVFSKSKSLVTVNARELESLFWDDKDKKCFVLDNHAMYTVDLRRPDTVGVVRVNDASQQGSGTLP